jgi:hypothetical protein
MSRRLIATVAALVAAFLAFASAAVTAYWLVGGTALLDTVGGELERLARSRSTDALLLGLGVVVAKVAAGWVALALTRRPSRRLATAAAVGGSLLALYGFVLTVAGALALTGAISTPPTDEHALRWHAVFWDPWFLLWGLALTIAGVTVRRRAASGGLRARSRG